MSKLPPAIILNIPEGISISKVETYIEPTGWLQGILWRHFMKGVITVTWVETPIEDSETTKT